MDFERIDIRKAELDRWANGVQSANSAINRGNRSHAAGEEPDIAGSTTAVGGNALTDGAACCGFGDQWHLAVENQFGGAGAEDFAGVLPVVPEAAEVFLRGFHGDSRLTWQRVQPRLFAAAVEYVADGAGGRGGGGEDESVAIGSQ